MKNIVKNWFILFIILIFILNLTNIAEARSGCCSHHGGVCGCICCDGTSLSAKCAPYYPSCNSNTNSSTYTPLITETKTNIYEDISNKNNLLVLVQEVIDGDTIRIFYNKDTIEKVRIIGIDTPETVDPRKPVECFGKEASQKMKELVEGRTVKLVLDTINDKRDKYNRLLRYIYLDNKDVGAEMIKQGYAYAYTVYPFEKLKEYKEYEQQANKNSLGLWAPGICDNPINNIITEKEPIILGLTNQNENKTTSTQQKNIKQQSVENKTTKQTDNTINNEDNFGAGFITGIILTLLTMWGYKKIRKNK